MTSATTPDPDAPDETTPHPDAPDATTPDPDVPQASIKNFVTGDEKTIDRSAYETEWRAKGYSLI